MFRDDDELIKLGFNSRGDNRTENAMRELGFGDADHVWFCEGGSDAFHVVANDMAVFTRFARVLAHHSVFLEIAVPNIFNFGGLRAYDDAAYKSARNDGDRFSPAALYKSKDDVRRQRRWAVLHPCKPSAAVCQLFVMGRDVNAWPVVGEPWL